MKYNLKTNPNKESTISCLFSAKYFDTNLVIALPSPKSNTKSEITDIANVYKP